MFSGETIKDIVSAEPAGFILTFSHGRVAHLTVKDQLGRPAIGIQFLRKSGGTNSGGFFSSIRNLVGSDRRQPVAAARSGRATKGQRDVVMITEEGELEHWSTHLNIGDSVRFEMNLKEDLLEALKHSLPDESKTDFRFKVLDFLLLEKAAMGNELASLQGQPSYPVLLLASLTHQETSSFYIIEVCVSAGASAVTVVHPISCYKARASEATTWKPRLCVPKPGQTAFVIFETTVVIFSMAKLEESPSSQLLLEGQRLPEPFQDCIRFQNDMLYRVLGFAPEDKDSQDSNDSCVLAVQGFGIVRITSTHAARSSEEPEESRITLKSRIEQSIFYGTIRQNPLDLTSKEQHLYSGEEVEEAALNISYEILGSTSKYIPKASPSLDYHLKLRAKALEDLVVHIQKYYGPVSRMLKWKLLWSAEKLAAAQAMWKIQEDIMRRKPKDRKETYWEQMIFFMSDNLITKADENKGETDVVRLWLTKDVYRIEKVLYFFYEGHKEVKEDDWLTQNEVVENIREASDLWTAGLDAAYRFREDNASLYGLGDEIFDTNPGVLKSGYKDLPESWTMEAKTVHLAESLMQLASTATHDWWDSSKKDDAKSPSRKTIIHMAHTLPKQVDLYLRMFAERYAWLMEQDHEENPERLDQARKMKIRGDAKRREYLHRIARLSLVQEAVDLAEHWRDMKSLVELHVWASRQLLHRMRKGRDSSDSEAKPSDHELEKIQERTEGYFEKYGSQWAKVHFDEMVMEGELGSLLGEGQTDAKKQPYLTQFLRRNAGYQKISWINDIVGEKNFGHAARTLEALTVKKNDDLWSKKTELCLAKLTRIAAAETEQKDTTKDPRVLTEKYDNRLMIMDLQSRLYAHVITSIGPVLDDAAAQQLALETFAKRIVGPKKYPTFTALLNDGFSLLLRRKALSPVRLIDLLTLMDPVVYNGSVEDDPQILSHEFWLALEVLRLTGIDPSTAEALSQIIWRRTMIRDDWTMLNDTTEKNDEDVAAAMKQSSLFKTLVNYYEHIQLHPKDASTIKVLSPSQVSAVEVLPKSIQKRFRENEIELVKHDMEAENEILKKYIEKGRLELHYGGLLKMAQATVRAEADRVGDEAAAKIGKA